jgi:hypothetical protein
MRGTEDRDPAEAGHRPGPDDAGIGQKIELRGPEEMGGLIDRIHGAIAVPRRRAGEDHRGVRQRHHRLRRNGLAVGAELAGERQPQHRARIPVEAGPCRPPGLYGFEKKAHLLGPGRDDLEHQPACRSQAEHARRRCNSVRCHPSPRAPAKPSRRTRRRESARRLAPPNYAREPQPSVLEYESAQRKPVKKPAPHFAGKCACGTSSRVRGLDRDPVPAHRLVA